MGCNIGGTIERVPYITLVHPKQEGNIALELIHLLGNGVMKELWTRWGYLGDGGCHERGVHVPILSLKIDEIK